MSIELFLIEYFKSTDIKSQIFFLQIHKRYINLSEKFTGYILLRFIE
jgi:hypothetical protein